MDDNVYKMQNCCNQSVKKKISRQITTVRAGKHSQVLGKKLVRALLDLGSSFPTLVTQGCAAAS